MEIKGKCSKRLNKFNHLSPVIHVALISQNHLLHVCARVLLDIPDPVLDVVEALLVGDVVDEHDAHRPAIVGSGDGAEPLLPGSVPDLELDLLAIKFNSTNLEINSYQERITNALLRLNLAIVLKPKLIIAMNMG